MIKTKMKAPKGGAVYKTQLAPGEQIEVGPDEVQNLLRSGFTLVKKAPEQKPKKPKATTPTASEG